MSKGHKGVDHTSQNHLLPAQYILTSNLSNNHRIGVGEKTHLNHHTYIYIYIYTHDLYVLICVCVIGFCGYKLDYPLVISHMQDSPFYWWFTNIVKTVIFNGKPLNYQRIEFSILLFASLDPYYCYLYTPYIYTTLYMWTEWSLFRMLSKVASRAPSVCVFQRFNGCNGGAACFPWNGHLSQQCVGEWSLEILRGLCTLYPRIVPICTPHVWCELISPNTKDGNLWISLLYICLN